MPSACPYGRVLSPLALANYRKMVEVVEEMSKRVTCNVKRKLSSTTLRYVYCIQEVFVTNTSGALAWKPDWPQAKANWIRWWQRQGMVIALHPRRQTPVEPLPEPPPPVSLEQRWLDPAYRAARTEYEMATHAFLAEGIPIFDTNIGPGSLGLFLGAGGHLDETTVWYSPCIDDPDAYGPIRFEPAGNVWL